MAYIKFALPFGHYNGSDRGADEVSKGSCFRHEAVDAKQQRDACYRYVADGAECGREYDEAAAGDCRRALRCKQADRDQTNLLQ